MTAKMWVSALDAAERTPTARERYVDLLRALSILAVVVGHWLVAAVFVRADGGLEPGHLLAIEPWTQRLTWVFQVMPVFFAVGGYANAVSWSSAVAKGRGYGEWLTGRLRRLLGPVVPLLLFWTLLAAGGRLAATDPEVLRLGSQVALVPVWFLAVYVLIVALAPVLVDLWDRFGWATVLVPAVAAALMDAYVRSGGSELIGYVNYLFVWGPVHQLGVAWRRGRLATPGRALSLGAAAFVLLLWLTGPGPYPVSMVGVPGEAVTNTQPPTVALLTLGVAQMGFLIALAGPARRLLSRTKVWAATVLVNQMIMSIYLWHLTVMVLVIGGALLLGGVGLHIEPATATWWWTRIPWLLVLGGLTTPVVLAVARFERPRPVTGPVPRWRPLVAVILATGGLALLASGGIADASGALFGIRLEAVVPPIAGRYLAG